jgi:hypothetical protein
VKGFVNATGCPCTIFRKGSGREKTAPGLQARQIHDNVIAGPPNVDVFSVDGKLQVGKDFEGEGHDVGEYIRERSECSNTLDQSGREEKRRGTIERHRQWGRPFLEETPPAVPSVL